ncbi:MAG: KEOPS complex subunit Cgi121 [Nitrosopumilaceae archaeon]|nr:KEOPS complex subunit Cgi121 [Nitrosopumilaceae archaeon]
MVTVRLIGGIKKSFNSEEITLEIENVTLEKLLALLLETQPKNTPKIDLNNIMIAINGADSSAINGKSTIIKKDDLVSIIPIIHGGSRKKWMFNFGRKTILAIELKGAKEIDVSFLDNLRKDFPNVKFQAISSKFTLNTYHLEKIISISLQSEKEKILLANKIETDILMRFASTNQISEAIKKVGIKPKTNVVLIAIGKKLDLDKLSKKLAPLTLEIFSKDNSTFLKKYFKISKKQLESVSSQKPLEDLLIEKAAVLVR